ncbi:MAG: acyltransferase family protein [Citrobacter sp.]
MRNIYIDNLKGLLITLVVIGHFIEPLLAKSTVAKQLYWFVYLFHMPLFVAISGYCSQAFLIKEEKEKIITHLLLPYIILQIIYTSLEAMLSGGEWNPALLTPNYTLWYLFSLFIWRLIFPYWMMLRWPLITAIVAGLLINLDNNADGFLSISRIFVFLPFFIVGALAHQKKFNFNFKFTYRSRLLAIIVILSAIALSIYGVYYNAYIFNIAYGRYSFQSLGFTWYEGIALRIIHYALATIISLALLIVIPKHKTVFAWIGRYSLYPYVLHGLIVQIAIASGVYTLWSQEFQVGVLILGAAGLTAALSTIYMRQATDFVLSGAGLLPNLVVQQRKDTITHHRTNTD